VVVGRAPDELLLPTAVDGNVFGRDLYLSRFRTRMALRRNVTV
jgi:hypothetical protein